MNYLVKAIWTVLPLLLACQLQAQSTKQAIQFTQKDTLRGMLRPERTCFDVHFYDLNIKLDPEAKNIAGYAEIHYTILENFKRLQIDLYENLTIDKIMHQGKELAYDRKYDAVFVDFPATQRKGNSDHITVHYHGQPQTAKMPPWDGGFAWNKDKNGQHWIGVACEGDGASLWWPNKDHLSDEPDSMMIRCAVPKGLTCVANGNLVDQVDDDGYTRFDWRVSYPINNYNVSLNIAEYAHFSDVYTAKDGGKLALDYYVLPENLEKAKKHFVQVQDVLAAFEKYFGKYPFWDDGYALVEVPYLGMEHQGAIAYGNRYMRGYLGMQPKGFNFDFIIVHETGHEYFGNSISCTDHAEMWIHESFTTYMEALFVEYRHGYDEATRYLVSQRKSIANKTPMLGPLGVNYTHWDDADYYFKGSWMLHTLRSIINDDDLWFETLYDLHDQHKVSHMNTGEIVAFFNKKTGLDLGYFFDQYLRHAALPKLELAFNKKGKKLLLNYRWKTDVSHFIMPVELKVKEETVRISPSNEWQEMTFKKVKQDEVFVNTQRFLCDVNIESN